MKEQEQQEVKADAIQAEPTEVKQRKTDHLFKKGQSGNPAGRPPGTKNFNTQFDKALPLIVAGLQQAMDKRGIKYDKKNFDIEDFVLQKMVENVMRGKESSLAMFLERRYGKQKSAELEVTVPTEGSAQKEVVIKFSE